MDSDISKDSRLVFAASVPAGDRRRVERLFFFNPQQEDSRLRIHETIEALGIPTIVEVNDKIWIEVSPGRTQCLFACDPAAGNRPVGVILYGRPTPETLWISHVAVDPEYGIHNRGDRPSVGIALFNQAIEIACRIRGIERIQLPYRKSAFLPIPPRESP